MTSALAKWLRLGIGAGVGLTVLALVSCGAGSAPSGAFNLSFRERDGKPLAQIHSNARAAARETVALAVGVTDGEVVGQPLDGGNGWRQALLAVQEPVLRGSAVVVPTASEFVGLDARLGTLLWRMPSNGQMLFAADDDGTRTVLTFGHSPTVLRVVDRSGATLLELEAPHPLGVPALRGPYVFVPWRDQFVSVFEVESGQEVGRLVLPRQVSQALVVGTELYFGEDALLRFDKEVAEGGPARGVWLTADQAGLPGNPRWFQRNQLTQALPLGATAFSRLFALPTGDSLEKRVFATSYFRLAMGFDADTRALLWTVTLPRPIVGGAAVAGGFVFCTSEGHLMEVASLDGGVRQVATLGGTLRACPVGAGDHRVANGAAEVKPHHEQLEEAVLLTDPQMAAAQLFLLQQTGNLTEPSLTETLIELLSRRNVPPELAQEARSQLSRRQTGAEHMIAALKRPYDFLSGVETLPPVGPLATALAALKHPEAAALLAAHLNDPAYDADSTSQVARALVVLAAREQAPELQKFFALNRALESESLAVAVNAVADTLLRLGTRDAETTLREAMASSMTHPTVKAHLQRALAGGTPQQAAGVNDPVPPNAARP